MPEGHSVHRIARQFDRNFVGRRCRASSPQGRFAEGAAVIDGRTATAVRAVGKQMFLEFDDDLWLRVHLGMYGAWDFAGEILVDPTIASANGRMGQTNQRGTALDDVPILDDAGENSLTSIGAPRRARVHVRMSEQTTGLADEEHGVAAAGRGAGAPAPAHRHDVRRPARADRVRAADARTRSPRRSRSSAPTRSSTTSPRARSASRRSVRRKPTPIGLLLMDQSVVSGIGNVYRAELLFRARQNPHTPGRDVPRGGRARAVARLGAAAGDRRRDRSDDDDGRSRSRRVPRARWPTATTGTGCTTGQGSRAGCAAPRSCVEEIGGAQALLVPAVPGVTLS